MATAQLDVDSNKFNLPVVKASAGPDGIVVSKLRNDGWVTLDPGFLTTAQCESKITYIDGKHSILRYCGYPIEHLCENSDFLEVAWLLRHGELLQAAQDLRIVAYEDGFLDTPPRFVQRIAAVADADGGRRYPLA